jgi:PAS domain S-box-containing protein
MALKSMSGIMSAKRKILVVEDEAIVAMHLSELLQSKGYDVVGIASDANAALEKYAAHQPDVILMDITIKGKKDGVELAKDILAKKGTPVIFLTAHADDETLRRVREVSPFGFILKPFKEAELCAVLEITINRFQEEQRLSQERQFLQSTLMSMGEAVIITDKDGRVQIMNDKAAELTGWDKYSAFLQPIEQVVRLIEEDSRQELECPVLTALRENRTLYLARKARLISKTGKEIPIADSAAPIRVEENGIVGAVMVFLDSSQQAEMSMQERQDLLNRIEEAKKEAAKYIAAGMAHNYNNVLAVLCGNLQLLKNSSQQGNVSAIEKHIQRIEESAARAAMLTEQLVGYTGQGKMLVSKINLNDLVHAVIEEQKAGLEKMEVKLSLMPHLPAVQGDASQLKRVIENIVRNGVEAIQEKAIAEKDFIGKILIETRAEMTDATPPDEAQKRVVCVAVHDNGVGIAPEYQKRIYEPFFSMKKAGFFAGLGLSMAQGVVRNHGGEISCRSQVGQGTTFLVRLPAVE